MPCRVLFNITLRKCAQKFGDRAIHNKLIYKAIKKIQILAYADDIVSVGRTTGV
jgi:hypothetical protein